MKKCTKCQQEKEFSKFSKSKTGKYGYKSYCKECFKQEKAEWYTVNKDLESQKKAEKYRNDPEPIKKRSKEYGRAHPNERRQRVAKWRYKVQYGITIEQYNQMLITQDNKCAICYRDQTQFNTVLCVDHCHKTGKVRGLLCNHCNLGFGLFEEHAERLVSASAYAIKHRVNQ